MTIFFYCYAVDYNLDDKTMIDLIVAYHSFTTAMNYFMSEKICGNACVTDKPNDS